MSTSPYAQPRSLLLLALALLVTAAGVEACERRISARARAACCAPCILLTVDPQSARPAVATRADVCPGDCTPAGAYCIKIVEARP
jgi:hypothetical protein